MLANFFSKRRAVSAVALGFKDKLKRRGFGHRFSNVFGGKRVLESSDLGELCRTEPGFSPELNCWEQVQEKGGDVGCLPGVADEAAPGDSGPAEGACANSGGMASDAPQALLAMHCYVQEVISLARSMTDEMVAVSLDDGDGMDAQGSRGLSAVMLDCMNALAMAPGGEPARAQELADFLTIAHSMLPQLGGANETSVVSAARSKAVSLVVQSALAEQQNPDHSLVAGERFDARVLCQALDDWVIHGAYRAGKDDAPLSEIARVIDMSSMGPMQACQTRLGLVIPVVVSARVFQRVQEIGLGMEAGGNAGAGAEAEGTGQGAVHGQSI